jgi:hypothetical protein
VAWRYSGVFREIARAESASPFLALSLSTALVLVGPRGRLLRSKNLLIQAQAFLTWFTTEAATARVEAKLRRAVLLQDEGYLQRAIGLWLRMPDPLRWKVWAAFLETVPHGVQCLFLETPPATAFERAHRRSAGVPKAFVRRVGVPGDHAAVLRVYEEFDQLIRAAKESGQFEVASIPADEDIEEVVGQVAAVARGYSEGRPVLVYHRDKTQPRRDRRP